VGDHFPYADLQQMFEGICRRYVRLSPLKFLNSTIEECSIDISSCSGLKRKANLRHFVEFSGFARYRAPGSPPN
jgi:hypothetical protein